MTNVADLFTQRQLVVLTLLNDLVAEARELILKDAVQAKLPTDQLPLNKNGCGSVAYADAIATYLALAVNRTLSTLCTVARWTASRDQTVTAFARQAIPMTWDFPEVNPFAGAAGDLEVSLNSVCQVIRNCVTSPEGRATQGNASAISGASGSVMILTDPPYYDNIAYADLSDFFYVWLRRSLQNIYPDLFSTVLVPKKEELVAIANRFDGDKDKARDFFENGLNQVFNQLRRRQNHLLPMGVFYAFKQTEEESEEEEESVESNLASTGWETMLEGLVGADFNITGTLPIRSELSNRLVAAGANALASSIVLVCRPRLADAARVTRREFLASLKKDLPPALRELQQGNIAPVDLAQASIGPGMAIFSKYREVLEPDGTAMRVRTALALINQALDEYLTEQEGEYDADTRWALAWFEQYGHEAGPYGVAETLSKAKNTGIDGLVRAGVLTSRGGKVHLLRRDELPEEWDPKTDERLTAWESVQYLVRALDQGGEQIAAQLLRALGSNADAARDLAYRLYALCERKGWAQDALGYNMLVVTWQRLVELGAQDKAQQETYL